MIPNTHNHIAVLINLVCIHVIMSIQSYSYVLRACRAGVGCTCLLYFHEACWDRGDDRLTSCTCDLVPLRPAVIDTSIVLEYEAAGASTARNGD